MVILTHTIAYKANKPQFHYPGDANYPAIGQIVIKIEFQALRALYKALLSSSSFPF